MSDEQTASHSEDVQAEPQVNEALPTEHYNEIMSQFGYAPKEEAKPVVEAEDLQDEDIGAPPAIEEPKNVRKVKYNKQEVEIEESKIDEYLQKGLALDKERERRSEADKVLQRAAKLAGFDKVEDYTANLDMLEKTAAQQKQDQFDAMKQQLREEAEYAGLDADKLEQFLDSHPLFTQAKEVLAREKEQQTKQQQLAQEQEGVKAWESLFVKYPDLAESMDAAGDGSPDWLTPDIVARINRGYDPIDAYELANRDKLVASDKQRTEQAILKQQRLNKRAKVEGNASPEPDDGVPENVKGAFALFGLDPKTAKKFMTKK